MDTCDVLIAGGGPGGAACAWKLRQAGLDVLVVDAATFPRDKVCAGWITPQVIEDLRIDTEDYRRGRVFQPITGFRTALIDGRGSIETHYDRSVSFGIRRCEFDHYLLQRSGARLRLGTPVASIRRDGSQWRVNGTICARMLVGAGGHFCPVARALNGAVAADAVVAAQEAEFHIDDAPGASRLAIDGEIPELYFCADLAGYGWIFRKGDYVNVGFGRLGGYGTAAAARQFIAFVTARHGVAGSEAWPWRGHAYLLSGSLRQTIVDAAVLLVGDAAGLASPLSGEGIKAAIESGLIAAATIAAAGGEYGRDRLAEYGRRVQERFGVGRSARVASRAIPASVTRALARRLVARPWFVRHVVLDRWFLHRTEPALAAAA